MHSKLYDITNMLIEKEQDPKEKQKFLYIKQILEDEKCFFKLDSNTSCKIIKDLGFSREETIEIYKELINSKNYQ